MNPALAMAMGGSASYGGGFRVEIFNDVGQRVSSYALDEREVVYLNNTNPINLSVWMKIDENRKKIVLLENQSCKAIGEVPYSE